ncbi:Long-chain-alcohol O-fatty-acyltransferase [Bertholletia excelsa]
MEGVIKNLIEAYLFVTASLCYCYFISSKIRKGVFRLVSLIPVFCLYLFLPLHLSSAFLTALTAFFITWLASFKLLLFAFDLGPLSSKPSKSLPLFITVACLPIRITNTNPGRKSQVLNKSRKLPLNLGTELVFMSVLIAVVRNYRDLLHTKVVVVMYCCLVFLMVDVLIAMSNVVVKTAMGPEAELEPPSDEPYLATSLQDFWGRRWNLMVTNSLRETVFRPVKLVLEGMVGPQWAALLAVMAAFVVSGLMHELLFYYVTPEVPPSWKMTGFFVLQGVCVVTEFLVKRWIGGRWRLPPAVSMPLTVGFVAVTGFWLFFPPVMSTGADVRVIEEFKMFWDFVKGILISAGEKIAWMLSL